MYRYILLDRSPPPNKQESVTDVVGQFVTHVPVRTPPRAQITHSKKIKKTP
jgi:hypothetical protein